MARLGAMSGRSHGHAYEAKSRGGAYSKVSHDVAHVVKEMPLFRSYANLIYAEIRAEALKHVETGRFLSSIHMTQGDVDWIIWADGVTYGWHTEFGHFVGNEETGRAWVKGIGVFRNVVARHGGY